MKNTRYNHINLLQEANIIPGKEYDFLVFVGRFQPLHFGHTRVIDRALELAKNVIIFVGSANSARSYRNPFTYTERKEMILSHYDDVSNLIIYPLNDYMYNDVEWVRMVQLKVNDSILNNMEGNTEGVTLHGLNSVKVGLIGCEKDHSSYYLKLFPQWDNESVSFANPLNASDIRYKYFMEGTVYEHSDWPDGTVPKVVYHFMKGFLNSPAYGKIQEEYIFVKKYKEGWKAAPYEPIFVTVDAVVIQSGHVLVVKRKASPGKGMMALPGGFLDPKETLDDAVIRELKEETKIKVPIQALKGSIKRKGVFDEPQRASRGRTITHAYLFELTPRKEENFKLPKVKGSDDAEKAYWVPLANLRAEEMFEDHWHIIQNMIGVE